MKADKIINGKEFAAELHHEIADAVVNLKKQTGKTPGLAVILVGEDPASEVYVRNKRKATVKAGMESFEFRMKTNVLQVELIAKIKELNNTDTVHGILVQLPLPDHISENAVIEAITPKKDVDGFHILNSGKLVRGQDGMVPCTPFGCLLLLKNRLGNLSGMDAIVIGRSNIVGKPMASLLLSENCTVTIAHSHTRNLPEKCRNADIIIAAVGKPKMIKASWVKKGAAVIDVGINRTEINGKSHLVGDVDFNEVQHVAGNITPVPGGVGPMTIACLLRNTIIAFCRINDLPVPTTLS